ncbi:cysteine--tRNA ligase [bacterium]
MLTIYNTLTKQKEEFVPLQDKKVKMYVCGITPYDTCHIGHARCYVTFDIVRRYLKFLGYDVLYIQNFTDVDDKIIAQSDKKGIPYKELAETYIKEFFDMMNALNVVPADVNPRVTDNIEVIIQTVKTLIDKGKAYQLDGDVYFKIKQFKEYGKLSGRSVDDLEAGARVKINEKKEDPLDFALWKKAKSGEPSWDSPWGHGRPGWHIECSVLSTKFLGATLDIHGGGADLIFPHHENEIAQAESLTEKQFVRFWMHNGFVMINKEKMSKSLGNIFSLADIFKKFNPMTLRIFLISQHYRSPLDFSIDKLEETQKRIDRFVDLALRVKEFGECLKEEDYPELLKLKKEFIDSMNDDFNSAAALSVLHKILDSANKSLDKSYIFNAWNKISRLADILGVSFEDYLVQTIDKDIEEAIKQRNIARDNKDWAQSDKIRKELEQKGVILEDTPNGTRWKKKR